MASTDFLANKLLEHQVGKTAYAMPTTYVGLSSTTPADDGTGVNEPVGDGYARVATIGADWATATISSIQNATIISFSTASADWVGGSVLTHTVLFDAQTGGNMLNYGNVTTPVPCLSGDTLSFAVGELDILYI